ncbi:MAG: cyclic nucleotide-binding domain-containing protein [Hyphomicrobiaceae bacterium]|nr:cyclic nucleotide-binding domain-containing protein [Hyphomicrobiaceae bacterium]
MAISSIVQPLLQVALFQGLTDTQLNEIARRAERIVFKPGDTIAMFDKPAAGAILLVSGEARRVAGPGVASVESLPPGTLIGEMGMLVETSSSSTVVAATSVRALRFSREEMLEQMAADPALAEHFISRITARLHDVASEMRAIDDGFGHIQADGGRAVPAARVGMRPDESARLH